MKKTRLYTLLGVAIVAIGSYYFFRNPSDTSKVENLLAEVKEAPLPVNIHAPGELLARR